jgi:hypothetical protein
VCRGCPVEATRFGCDCAEVRPRDGNFGAFGPLHPRSFGDKSLAKLTPAIRMNAASRKVRAQAGPSQRCLTLLDHACSEPASIERRTALSLRGNLPCRDNAALRTVLLVLTAACKVSRSALMIVKSLTMSGRNKESSKRVNSNQQLPIRAARSTELSHFHSLVRRQLVRLQRP